MEIMALLLIIFLISLLWRLFGVFLNLAFSMLAGIAVLSFLGIVIALIC